MTEYIQIDCRVDAIKVPYNEFGDNPLEWPEIPEWLDIAFKTGKIWPEFKGEDYYYYNVLTNVGKMTLDPDYYLVKFPDGSLAGIPAGVFRDKFTIVEDPTEFIEDGFEGDPTNHICLKCGLPIVSGDSVIPLISNDLGIHAVVLTHKICPDVGLVAG